MRGKHLDWQQQIKEQLGQAGADTRDVRTGQETLRKDMACLTQVVQGLVHMIQGGSLSQPRPANLSGVTTEQTIAVTQQDSVPPQPNLDRELTTAVADTPMPMYHPDPPQHGAGNI